MGVIGWMGVGEGGRIRPIMTFPLKREEFQRTCGFVDIWYFMLAPWSSLMRSQSKHLKGQL